MYGSIIKIYLLYKHQTLTWATLCEICTDVNVWQSFMHEWTGILYMIISWLKKCKMAMPGKGQ